MIGIIQYNKYIYKYKIRPLISWDLGWWAKKKWEKYDILLGEYYRELCNYKIGDYLVDIDKDGFRGYCIDSEKSELGNPIFS